MPSRPKGSVGCAPQAAGFSGAIRGRAPLRGPQEPSLRFQQESSCQSCRLGSTEIVPVARLALIGFRPGPGGVGRVMTNLVNGFIAAGVEVDLLLPAGEHPDLGAIRGPFTAFTLESPLSQANLTRLEAYLRDRRPTAVLSNKDQSNALLAATAHAIRPRSFFRVGTNVGEKLRREPFLTRFRERRRLATLYAAADGLIANSPGVAEALGTLLQSRPQPAVETIWNPLDLEHLRQLAKQPPTHPWLADSSKPLILSAGRLAQVKDFQTMIRAFAQLRRTLDCRLIILGEGGQRDRLLRLARRLGVEQDMDLPGFAANPFPFFARADLFVLSSVFEGSPNALMEALAVGTPCVATDCPSGPREILEGGRYGRLVPIKDPAALAHAMLETIRKPLARPFLRRAAGRFDLKQNTKRYLEVMGLADPSSEETMS